MAALMTQADYARHRGVSKPAVSNWKKAELIVFAEDPSDGRLKVDVARTDAKLNARIDPMRGRPAGGTPAPASPIEEAAAAIAAPASGESLQSVRMELLKRQSTGQALKNAEAARELGAIVELERRANEIGRAARERIQAWFRGAAERLAAERDARTIMAFGEEEIDRVFAELADHAEAGAFGDDSTEEAAADAEDAPALAAAEAAIDEAA
jgi:hypothetical protein